MTVGNALALAEARLREHGVPDPRLDGEYLLAEALGAPRLSLRLEKGRVLTEAEKARFLSMLKRREGREPLQYILGTQPFMGLDFKCDPRALIPRNDTECVCEEALRHIRPGMAVLDLCTGSGALAAAIRKLCPGAAVYASDISADALSLARENARRLGAEITFAQGDLFAPFPETCFDLIVCNPPYIPEGLRETLQAEVRREPETALFAGLDGLLFYRRIAREAPEHLNAGGYLVLEIGDDQFAPVSALLEKDFSEITLTHDLSGRPRCVSARYGK